MCKEQEYEEPSWFPEMEFDPSDVQSDGIEEDGSLNEAWARFWLGE